MINRSLVAPVLTLCFVQAISTAIVTSIYPFVASLLLSMDVEARKVPIYAGWADSTLSVVYVICLPIHIEVVRYFAHRQLLVATLMLSGGIAGVVGFCTSPWQLVLLRGLTGAVQIGDFLSVLELGELMDEEHRNEAFSWHAGGNAMGSVMGSIIGGYISEPNGRIPLFSGVRLLRDFPYAGPGLVLWGMAVLASAAVLFFVRETNPRYNPSTSVSDVVSRETNPAPTQPSEGRLTTKMICQSLRFLHVSLAEFANRVCMFGCLALLSTAGRLSPSIGGLGLEISKIASVLLVAPLLTLVNSLMLFPIYSRHLSYRCISIISSGCWLLPAAFFPIAVHLATRPASHQGLVYVLWYVGEAGGMTWWTLKSLLLLRLYPHSDDRTMATGIIRLATNAGIIIGAAGSTHMFSIASGFPAGSFGRQLAWIFIGGCAVVTLAVAILQPEMEEPDLIINLAQPVAVDEETPLLRGSDDVE